MMSITKSAMLLAGTTLLLLVASSAWAGPLGGGGGGGGDDENVRFVEMILSFLNNQLECQLPTYAEVDLVQSRLAALEKQTGSMLTDDQKLLRETVLDQWDSFQQYLNSQNVLKAAKKRAFLGKVERYQEAKFGESICIKQPDTKVLDNEEYQKNPLVRYVKLTGGQAGSDAPGDVESTTATSKPVEKSDNNNDIDDSSDVELKFKVHTRDDSGKIIDSKHYAGKFKFDSSRTKHRIALHLGGDDK